MINKIDVKDIPTTKPGMTFEERREVWLKISQLTPEQFDTMWEKQAARQSLVPVSGTEAPDFELSLLDRENGRSGETVRLSNLRGKPVGLIFGSFT